MQGTTLFVLSVCRMRVGMANMLLNRMISSINPFTQPEVGFKQPDIVFPV